MRFNRRASGWSSLLAAGLVGLGGCGEPSARELKNRQEFEALLTAVSLQNKTELERDATRIRDRHAAGELADGSYDDLRSIIETARRGDWPGAERQAYELREKRPYFR